jgi:hypothetical protein
MNIKLYENLPKKLTEDPKGQISNLQTELPT